MIKMIRDHDKHKVETETDILRRNVKDLQEQLANAYKRIDELSTQVIDLQRQQTVDLGRS